MGLGPEYSPYIVAIGVALQQDVYLLLCTDYDSVPAESHR
jgi:hypothetical protein